MAGNVIETIRVVVTGANPRTYTFTVAVDPATGIAPTLNIPLVGTNVGTDTVIAYMDSHGYASNPAVLAWHGAPVLAPVPPQVEPGYVLQSSAASGHPRPWDGDDVSNHPGNVVIVYYNDIHDRNPSVDPAIQVGAYVYMSGGSLTPAQQGIHRITGVGADKPYHDTQDTHNWFTYTVGGPAVGTWLPAFQQYQIATISSVVSPPVGAAGTAQLRLSPYGGITGWSYPPTGDTQNWQLQGTTNTLHLTIGVGTPVTYTTKPYIPLLATVAGSVNVFNDPSNAFLLPTFNSHVPDKPTAAATIFKLAGDNNSWQGRLSTAYVNPNFTLGYNGTVPDAHVGTTQLTITADDIAWYFDTNKTFDLFQYSSQGGGTAFSIEIDWLFIPSVASVSPTSIPADGGVHTLAFNLALPLPPLQNSTIFTVSFAGQQPSHIGAVSLITDGQGWVTGFSVPVTSPSLSSSTTATPSYSAIGTITYLKGTSFATEQPAGYPTNLPTQVITWTGSGLGPAPVHYAWSTVPAPVSGVVNLLNPSSVVVTATFYSRSNNIGTAQFYKQNKTTSVRTAIQGAIAATNKRTAIVGGSTAYLADFVITIASASLDLAPGDLLGYIGNDTDAQTVTFWDTNTYEYHVSGGGGGGGGCPAVEMYVDEWHQVSDAFVGMGLDCLEGETSDYLLQMPKVDVGQIQWLDFSTQICYHLIAKNGAELIVSCSTPIPTLEMITAIAQGTPESELALLASDVAAGMHVITDIGNGLEWSELTDVVLVGMRRVARLYCGGRNFAAGVRPGKYIYSHNLMIVK